MTEPGHGRAGRRSWRSQRRIGSAAPCVLALGARLPDRRVALSRRRTSAGRGATCWRSVLAGWSVGIYSSAHASTPAASCSRASRRSLLFIVFPVLYTIGDRLHQLRLAQPARPSSALAGYLLGETFSGDGARQRPSRSPARAASSACSWQDGDRPALIRPAARARRRRPLESRPLTPGDAQATLAEPLDAEGADRAAERPAGADRDGCPTAPRCACPACATSPRAADLRRPAPTAC